MFLEGKSLELLIAAVVALVVVGPKDLPILLRKLGQFMARLRGMAAEFRASFDEMARQSELDELRKEVEALRRGQLADIGQTQASEIVGDINQHLSDVGVQLHPPMSYQYSPPPAEPLPPVSPPSVGEEPTPRAPKRKTAAKAKSRSTPAKASAPAKTPAKPRTRKSAAKTTGSKA